MGNHIDSDGSGFLSIKEVADLVYHVIKNGPGGGDDHHHDDHHDGHHDDHMEEAAHDLAEAGTEYSHEMDEIESACHQELTEFENAIAVDDPEIAHMEEHEMVIAQASYMIFKMIDKDESGCIDHHEYFEMLEVIHKEEPDDCNGLFDFICGTHFDAEGKLNKHGAEEDFDRIDQDGSGYLSINEVANLVYHAIMRHVDPDHPDHHDGHHGSGDHHGDHIHCANGRC